MLAASKLATSEFKADVPGSFAYLRQRSRAAFEARDLRELNACASLLIAIEFPINDTAKIQAAQLCVEWLTLSNELLNKKEGFDDHAYFLQWTVLDIIRQWCLSDVLGDEFAGPAQKIIAHFTTNPDVLRHDDPAIVLGLLSHELKHMKTTAAKTLFQSIVAQEHPNIKRVLQHEGL